MTRKHWIPRFGWLALALGFNACGTPALQHGDGPSGGGGYGGGPSGGGGYADGYGPGGGAPDGGAPEVPSVGSSCGDGTVGSSLLWITASGAPSGPYEGPAVVERSTPTQLLLAFDAPAPAAGTNPEDVLPRRATIGGLGAKLLPVGAKVWLTKDPAVSESSFPFAPPRPWTFSVRDKKGGRLLLGGASRTTNLAPIPFGNARVTCETPFHDSCVARGTLRHSTFDVQGDTTVTVGDGETGLVRQGGVDYDVTVWAQEVVYTSMGACSDYLPASGFAVSFVAHDLAALVATLEVGPAPACGYGNFDAKTWGAGLTALSNDAPYEGPVTFEKREMAASGNQTCDWYGTVGLTGSGTSLPEVYSCGSPGLFPAPAAGQQLWFSHPTVKMGALRQSKNGPLLVASIYNVSPADSAGIANLLGTSVEVRQSCAYVVSGPEISSLREVVFGMTPPVVVRAGGHAVITIGGQQVDVWLTATSEPLLTVAAH